jgi:hypothetical protein
VAAMPDTSYLYAIGSTNGPIKVGHSMDVSHRLGQLQAKVTQRLFITGKWPVGQQIALAAERYAHWLLRDHSLGREWFDVSREQAVCAIERALAEDVDAQYPLPSIDFHSREIVGGEHISAKFAKGTRARLNALVGRGHAQFLRETVEAELRRREAGEGTACAKSPIPKPSPPAPLTLSPGRANPKSGKAR